MENTLNLSLDEIIKNDPERYPKPKRYTSQQHWQNEYVDSNGTTPKPSSLQSRLGPKTDLPERQQHQQPMEQRQQHQQPMQQRQQLQQQQPMWRRKQPMPQRRQPMQLQQQQPMRRRQQAMQRRQPLQRRQRNLPQIGARCERVGIQRKTWRNNGMPEANPPNSFNMPEPDVEMTDIGEQRQQRTFE